MKAAWRQRAWRYSRPWRILFVMMAGAILLVLGLFGLIVLLGSPGIKLVAIVAVLYAFLRTAIGFSRA